MLSIAVRTNQLNPDVGIESIACEDFQGSGQVGRYKTNP